LRRRESDRLVIHKASEQRLWDEVKAHQKQAKARADVVHFHSDEDTDEESGEENDDYLDTPEDTVCNTCLSLSCVVVFFLVSNLLIMHFVLTRQE
jgi:hypothetical protein